MPSPIPSLLLSALLVVPTLGGPLNFTISHKVQIGDVDQIDRRHKLFKSDDLTVTCVDCSASGEVEMEATFTFGNYPELDTAIEAAPSKDGKSDAHVKREIAGHKKKKPGWCKEKHPQPTCDDCCDMKDDLDGDCEKACKKIKKQCGGHMPPKSCKKKGVASGKKDDKNKDDKKKEKEEKDKKKDKKKDEDKKKKAKDYEEDKKKKKEDKKEKKKEKEDKKKKHKDEKEDKKKKHKDEKEDKKDKKKDHKKHKDHEDDEDDRKHKDHENHKDDDSSKKNNDHKDKKTHHDDEDDETPKHHYNHYPKVSAVPSWPVLPDPTIVPQPSPLDPETPFATPPPELTPDEPTEEPVKEPTEAPANAEPPQLDGPADSRTFTGIQLPLQIVLETGDVLTITKNIEPFGEMTEPTRDLLRNWRTSPNEKLRLAMEEKALWLAAWTLAGGFVAEEEELQPGTKTQSPDLIPPPPPPPGPSGPPDAPDPPDGPDDPPPGPSPPEEDCDNPWNDLVTGLTNKAPIKKSSTGSRSIASGMNLVVRNALEGKADGNMFDKIGQWIRNHVSEVSVKAEATEEIVVSKQLEVVAKEDVRVALTWDWFGFGRSVTNVGISYSDKKHGSLIWAPEFLRKDTAKNAKAPIVDTPSNVETPFGNLNLQIAPLSLGASVGVKGDTDMTLPGFRARVPQGSTFSIDVLREDVVQNSFTPEIEYLEPKSKGFHPDTSLSISAGTKAEVKIFPGLKTKDPENECIETFTQALKWLVKWTVARITNDVPKWLDRLKIGKFGFGDPLSVAAKYNWLQLDFNFKEVENVDSQCNKGGDIEKALSTQTIFRTGLEIYANVFFWKVGTGLAPNLDPSKVAVPGMIKSKDLGSQCYPLEDTQAAFEGLRNVTESADVTFGDDSQLCNCSLEDNQMDELKTMMWTEAMAGAANDTARALAPLLGVKLEDIGLSENRSAQYKFPRQERDEEKIERRGMYFRA